MRGNFNKGLIDYYQRELTYLREAGGAFAKKFPKVAARLQIGRGESQDPQVERLLESFAFLTARVQRGFDAEFPVISTALLGAVYPHLLNPIPSMTIAHFLPDPTQVELTTGHAVARESSLFAQSEQGQECHFRTCSETVLWPLEVVEAGIEAKDRYDFLDDKAVSSVLKIRLRVTGETPWTDLGVESLRFYINADLEKGGAIYETLFTNVESIAVVGDDKHDGVRFLSPDSLTPVGFDDEDAALPHPPQAHPAYRLLQEYFAFPQKFLFFELGGLAGFEAEGEIELVFALKSVPEKTHTMTPHTFLLGCTPIINLFTRISDPIRVDETKSEYLLMADVRRETSTEIHSIQSVSSATDARDAGQVVQPFFHHSHPSDKDRVFWSATRKECERVDLSGTNMYLSFVDLDFSPAKPAQRSVFAHTLCTNRSLADQVPDGAALQVEDAVPEAGILCLGKPTAQISPPLGGATLWRLVSHLSVNFLSLSDDKESLAALREIFRLYSCYSHASIEQQIEGIRAVSCKSVVRRTGDDAWRGFCRGNEVTVSLDERYFVGSSAFLLGTVLNKFFSLYVSVNSFSQLVLKKVGDKEQVWKRWEPVGGDQKVL